MAGGDEERRSRESQKNLSVVDRRRVGLDGEASTSSEPNLKPTFVQELEERTKRAEAALKHRVAELDAEALRVRARIQGDLEQRFERKERDLLLEVLEILDDVGRAAELTSSEAPAVAQGLGLLASRTDRFLQAHGCEKFSPEGQPFDPETMEAVSVLDGPEGEVVQIFQPGYLLGADLLRPAKVAVGRTSR
jgi:molecular chaperone GrpE